MSNGTTIASSGLALSQWACLDKCVPCRMCDFQDNVPPGIPYHVQFVSQTVDMRSTNWGLSYFDGISNVSAPLVTKPYRVTHTLKVDLNALYSGTNNVLGFCKPNLIFDLMSYGVQPAPWGVQMLILGNPAAYDPSLGYHNYSPANGLFSFLNCSFSGAGIGSTGSTGVTAFLPATGYKGPGPGTPTAGSRQVAWMEADGIPPIKDFPSSGIWTFDLVQETDSLFDNGVYDWSGNIFINRMIPNYLVPFKRRIRVPLIGVRE